ncbi:MAG TPA: amidohydrolase family protein [Mycobacteriales bacterium]|nr:amidohydrolase family protein [Mycobacteriales bacterium]
MKTVDADQHLFETRTMWRDHIDPALRDKALAIEDDDLGYAWLTWKGERLYLAEPQQPLCARDIGRHRLRQQRGEPAETSYDEQVPASYTDAAARLVALDDFGLDAAVLFPNFGLIWEEMLTADREALTGNLTACNRWQAENAAAGGGRLFPVAHLTLCDVDWAVAEITRLGRDGVRLAMVAPAPVNGKRLSHPDHHAIWAAFCDAGVSPVFHVGNFKGALDPAWYESDPDPADRLLDSVFLNVAPAVALADLILNGTLERYPDLRIGVVELTAAWVPSFLVMLDGASEFYALRHGRTLYPLKLRPSEYFVRQVRVGALAYEGPADLVRMVGDDTFMFGSDWPHAEGIAKPYDDYAVAVSSLSDAARSKVMAENVSWLLRM